jgi:hypothetical protein
MTMDDNNNKTEDTKDAVDSTDSPKFDADALREAKYAALASRARTEEAKQLVDHVFMLVLKADGSPRRRPNQNITQQLRLGVEGFVGDLLRYAGHAKAKGHVYRSLHSDSFTGEDVGRTAFKQIRDQLMALGLLKHFPGGQTRVPRMKPSDPEWVINANASRFKATPELLELAARFGIYPDNARAHFILALPRHPLQRKAASRRSEWGKKLDGKRMRIDHTRKTNKLEADLHELNKFLDGFELRGGTHRGYIRIYNQGDDPAFDWNMGARIYSQGDDSYQRMKEHERLKMTIDGEPVCEIDIKASYLTIHFARLGRELDWKSDPDPYAVPGVRRDIVKLWFVATFGYDKHLERWPREIAKAYREETGRQLGKDFKLSQVRQKALTKFPVLQDWGNERNAWATLMWLESEAVISTMLRLMRDHAIPSYSVHDSIIVPVSKQDIARQVLTEEYRRVVGVTPMLETEELLELGEGPKPS